MVKVIYESVWLAAVYVDVAIQTGVLFLWSNKMLMCPTQDCNPCSDLPLGKGTPEYDAMPTLIEVSPVPPMGSKIPVTNWNTMNVAQRYDALQAEIRQTRMNSLSHPVQPGGIQCELCQTHFTKGTDDASSIAETRMCIACLNSPPSVRNNPPGFQEIPATPIADLQARVHGANLKWWKDLDTGRHLDRNKGEMLALIHSEISECLEGIRKNLMDDKLPHRKMALADAMIRILDYAGGFKLDLQGAFEDKMAYNATRADHDPENRRGTHGKKF